MTLLTLMVSMQFVTIEMFGSTSWPRKVIKDCVMCNGCAVNNGPVARNTEI